MVNVRSRSTLSSPRTITWRIGPTGLPQGSNWTWPKHGRLVMLGFELDFWDHVTFASLAAAGVAFILIIVFIGGLPGRIAVSRNHPDAQAVTVLG